MTLVQLARKLRPFIEKAAESLEDADAVEAVELFPEWKANTTYDAGKRLRYGGTLYKVQQVHVSQHIYPPGAGTEALYTVVNVTNAGTASDPIPYNGNMILKKGKHYSQDGVVYLCTRDTGIAVYNALSALVGLYVEAV